MFSSLRSHYLHAILWSVGWAGASGIATADMIDFEELSLPLPNSAVIETFSSGGAEFAGELVFAGCQTCWHGWIYSNSILNQDLSVDPGLLISPPQDDLISQISTAYVPPDGATSKYAVSSLFASTIDPVTGRTAPRSPIVFPAGETIVSLDITNTAYAAHSIIHGDDFNDPFGPTDEFILTIIGEEQGVEVGSVDVVLATGSSVLDVWTTISLASLTGADTLWFALASTKTDDFGMTTPSYVAVDNILTKLTPSFGDFNDSGLVDLDDLNLLLFNWSMLGSEVPVDWVNWRPGNEQHVGLGDLNDVLFNWNTSPPVVTVPEPIGSWLMLIGLSVCPVSFAFARIHKGC
jgi:hypothetical protein